MAKSALDQLQAQIEAIRREAYAAGYAAAMEAVRGLAARPAPGAATTAKPAPPSAKAARPGRRSRRTRPAPANAAPLPRGGNARLVEEVLRSIAPRPARPAEIRNALRRERGVVMAFTSIRHALNQLAARDVIEQIDDTKTWRVRAQGGASKGG